MAVIPEVAVSIQRVLSSVCVTLSLAFSWEVTKEPVLVRTSVFCCVIYGEERRSERKEEGDTERREGEREMDE